MRYKKHRHALSNPMQLSLCLLVFVLSLTSVVLGSRLLVASVQQHRIGSVLSDGRSNPSAPSNVEELFSAQTVIFPTKTEK